MIDEWPIIEKRIRSFDMVFEKVDLGVEVKIEEEAAEGHSILDDDDVDFGLTGEKTEEAVTQGITLTAHEGRVYNLVDGKQAVQDIIYKARLSEFETCKTLYDLTTRSLVREVAAPGKAKAAPRVVKEAHPSAAVALLGYAIVLVLSGFSLWIMPKNPVSVVGWMIRPESDVQRFRKDWSKGRLTRVDYALQVFSLLNRGMPPPDLDTLLREGLLREGEDRDPWGRRYQYRNSAQGYTLEGLDARGDASPELRIDRALGP